MDSWAWWLVAAVILGVVEVFTTFLVFGMFALGALAAAAVAFLGGGDLAQALVCVVVAVALLIVVRPVARRHLLRTPPGTRTGVAALIGARAVVVERVDARTGRVKIGGEVWSARAYDPTQVLEPGTTVDVIEIEGATALVYGPESL